MRCAAYTTTRIQYTYSVQAWVCVFLYQMWYSYKNNNKKKNGYEKQNNNNNIIQMMGIFFFSLNVSRIAEQEKAYLQAFVFHFISHTMEVCYFGLYPDTGNFPISEN